MTPTLIALVAVWLSGCAVGYAVSDWQHVRQGRLRLMRERWEWLGGWR